MTFRLTILLLCASFFVALGLPTQPVDPTRFDYSKADSIALNFPKKKYKHHTELVAPLTENLHTDHEKVRVLFRWITDNIAYRYAHKTQDADKVVKRKKAVCSGYSTLLKEMCKSAGIECEIISGYAKTEVGDIAKKFTKTDHAWNAVKLYGKWYLMDVTWATGYYNEHEKKHVKHFNDLYFLTDPELFVKKHLPKNKKWQLLDTARTRTEFTKTPIYYNGYFDQNIEDLKPGKGIIKMQLEDTLEIQFKADGIEINQAIIELGNEQFIYQPKVQKAENYYFIRQKFEKHGDYKLTLFLNRESVAAYSLTIKEPKK